MSNHLIVFTRFPTPGTTKTRMIPKLGSEGAADLQRKMTEHTLAIARAVRDNNDVSLSVYYTDSEQEDMKSWLGDDLDYNIQAEGDLGDRLNSAFSNSLSNSARNAVIIGTDCPDITPTIIANAFEALNDSDVVLGPANDGGYYLIGLNHPCPQLLKDVPWGSENTFKSTAMNAADLSLSLHRLEPLSDVDYPKDLPIWEKHSSPDRKDKVSVIIPALNEALLIEKTIKSAAGDNIEVIVVDGGSSDDTQQVASNADATVITSAKGRAGQMNEGARKASGDILLFLHADTILPAKYDDLIRAATKSDHLAAGAFHLAITPSTQGTRLTESMVKFRSTFMKMPYGDQAIFMRKETFEKVGGYQDIPIMEDFDIIRRLKKTGHIKILSGAVKTSSRRWEKLGLVRTTFINQLMIAGYYLGISTEKLADFYRRQK
jgi:rSAM/selenodomain-associated transferase 2/rSAM/selenodomain-associated transferase 1